MRLVKPSVEFLWMTPEPLKAIEQSGRVCWKSEDKVVDGSAEKFVSMLIRKGHEAMIEHASASYKIICDRGVTHEIVRHRLFSYAQESTRYCNYKGGVTFIIPPWLELEIGDYAIEDMSRVMRGDEQLVGLPVATSTWLTTLYEAEWCYIRLLDIDKWTPQQARSVLPNALKTEIVITGNLREWKHFFKLRCTKLAHPQMQEVANMILEDIQKRIPIIFDYKM